MKLKQLMSFIVSFLCMLLIIALTGGVVNKMIGIGWYIVLVAILAMILQIALSYLHKQTSDGEWL